MPERRSRHERMQQLQTTTSSTSIFDLAKTAQARVRGMDDPFLVSKKQRQHIEIKRPQSYVPSSPSSSDTSESEESGWFSDLDEDSKEHEEHLHRQAHRAAALAALEGRAAPVEGLQPIFRSARMEYDDDVEAEHGQLHTYQPKPRRPAARFQRRVNDWEGQLTLEDAQSALEEVMEICDDGRNGASDVLEWLRSETPVDLLHGRPKFYYQQSSHPDEFWGELTLEELNSIA